MDRLRELVQRYSAGLAALLVVTIWGTNFVFQKAALAEFDVFAFNFLRFSGMLALGWSVVYLRGKFGQSKPAPTAEKLSLRERFQQIRPDLPRMMLTGLLGYTLYIVLSSVGLSYTTAFSNALLIATAPLFAGVLLWALRLEQIVIGQWLAMLMALVGVFIFLVDKIQSGFSSVSLGDLISLTAAFFFAAYTVVNKPLLTRYPAPVLTTYTMTLGGIPVLLFSLPALFSQDWSRVSPAAWGALIWSIIFPVYFAWTVWSWVNARIGVARTSVFMYLVPVIGGATSWFLLGEGFGFQKILGALIIIGSLALTRYASSRKPAPPPLATPIEPLRETAKTLS